MCTPQAGTTSRDPRIGQVDMKLEIEVIPSLTSPSQVVL